MIRAQNFVARYHDAYDHGPRSLGPNVRANYEMGTAMSLADAAWAHAEQTRIFRRFQQTFRDYDLVLSPTTCRSRRFPGRSSISPRWRASRCATTTTGWR